MTKPCELCHGTGQRCYFGGESRFVLTWQDCPECFGTGEVPDQPEPSPDRRSDAPDNVSTDQDAPR
jgi:DnaJ-class molecular chaperone